MKTKAPSSVGVAPQPSKGNGLEINRLLTEPSHFGAEIGGYASYEELPGYRPIVKRRANKICKHCRKHKALFKIRGRVKFDRHHTLCQRCYRSALASAKAALRRG